MSLELVKAMKLTTTLEEEEGLQDSHVICFAGRTIANFWLLRNDAAASWYMGQGLPKDFPPELDIWIWGGISLTTERIMWKTELYHSLSLVPLILSICFGLPLWFQNHNNKVTGQLMFWIIVAWTLFMLIVVFLWRIHKIRKAVKEILAPKLNPLGFDIVCHQRPWFSYYTIHRSYTAIVSPPPDDPLDQRHDHNNKKKDQSPHHHHETDNNINNNNFFVVSSTNSMMVDDDDEDDDAEEEPYVVKIPVIMSIPWDWQGYTRIFPGTQFNKMQYCLEDVWIWGAVMETIRGRTHVAETNSPPLVRMRRLRRLRSLGTISFQLFVVLTLFYLYFLNNDIDDDMMITDEQRYDILMMLFFALQGSLLLLFLFCSFCWTGGYHKPLLVAEPLLGIVKATIEEMGPIIEEKTNGITMELDEMVNRVSLLPGGLWNYDRYCIKMYYPPPLVGAEESDTGSSSSSSDDMMTDSSYGDDHDDSHGVIVYLA